VIRERVPALAAHYDTIGWKLPANIDRIYSSARAQSELGWQQKWGWEEVIAQSDRDSIEVLPAGANVAGKAE